MYEENWTVIASPVMFGAQNGYGEGEGGERQPGAADDCQQQTSNQATLHVWQLGKQGCALYVWLTCEPNKFLKVFSLFL